MRRGGPSDEAHSWDQRLYPGLSVEAVPSEVRAALVRAAGTLGVEAEYFLGTVETFVAPAEHEARSRVAGEAFLWQLEASAERLRPAAESFEVATQAYLTSLEARYPELRRGGGGAADNAEPWWPAMEDDATPLAALDLYLRHCGFSYRRAVEARLTPNVEALIEQLHLLLHALNTLPPVGVLPISALYDGLDELASTFQGHVVPHLLADLSHDKPGLLAGIRRLRELDAVDDRSVELDIAWARAQLSEVRQAGERALASLPSPTPERRRGLAGLFRHATPPAPSASSSPRAWLALAEQDWRETIAALEAIRTQATQAQSII